LTASDCLHWVGAKEKEKNRCDETSEPVGKRQLKRGSKGKGKKPSRAKSKAKSAESEKGRQFRDENTSNKLRRESQKTLAVSIQHQRQRVRRDDRVFLKKKAEPRAMREHNCNAHSALAVTSPVEAENARPRSGGYLSSTARKGKAKLQGR